MHLNSNYEPNFGLAHCGLMVGHRSGESVDLRFNCSNTLHVFSLINAYHKSNYFYYFFNRM